MQFHDSIIALSTMTAYELPRGGQFRQERSNEMTDYRAAAAETRLYHSLFLHQMS